MTIQTVIQQEETGCGLACVAMLAGRSYEEVRERAGRLGIFAADENLWSDTAHVRRLLSEYGIAAAATESPFSGWDDLPDLALLAIKYYFENGRPFWHWTVFERSAGEQVVHDPAAYLATNRRTDLERIEPQWFIAIPAT